MSAPATPYRGRFAPTPTGPLHMGSLVTALASYLDARHHDGTWLVRIEDIDPQREQPEATQKILTTLTAHGLTWDETVRYQSRQSALYEVTLDRLRAQKNVYQCPCSRKQLQQNQGLHLSHCPRAQTFNPPSTTQNSSPETVPSASRFRVVDTNYVWSDRICGECTFSLTPGSDDFVVKRREGFYAYQLAVVADDIDQHITHIVRGQDLLDNTPMQLSLYQALGQALPRYAHTPLILNAAGQKLSKQNHARAIDDREASKNLSTALQYLNHALPNELNNAPVPAILQWATENWAMARLCPLRSITHPEPPC